MTETQQVLDTCRQCGAKGLVWTDLDPCPGLCPRCLDTELAALTAAALVLMELPHPPNIVPWMRDKLLDLGFPPVWAERFISGDLEASEAAIAEVTARSSR